MDTTAILAILKWLFPSFMGSVLAIYKKATVVGWDESTLAQKRKLVLLGFGAVVMSIFVAYMIGGAVLEAFDMTRYKFGAMIIYFFLAFSGLKITDAVADNLDLWIDKCVNTISTIIDSVSEKIKGWFS